MDSKVSESVQTIGHALEQRIFSEIATQPVSTFDALQDVKNLRGDSTGYVKVFTGEYLDRASSLSIDIMPGVRYFNIHIIPEDCYDIPRFLFEGMAAEQGSQVACELFPDKDIELDYDGFSASYSGFESIYEEGGDPTKMMTVPSLIRKFSEYLFTSSARVATLMSDQGKSQV